MTGRVVPTRILITEQGELSSEVQLRLQRDQHWFLSNPTKLMFKRPYQTGEAYPYEVNASATVVVTPTKRTFIVDEKCVLVIEEPAKKVEKVKRKHKPFSVSLLQAALSSARKAKRDGGSTQDTTSEPTSA